MNELPRVNGADNGIFRRVKIVAFPAIPEHERRPELKEAVRAEAAGILNWALEGLRRLEARGRFAVPAAVEAASRAFALQNDIPKIFVDERCEVGPELSVGSTQLYNAYRNWCDETGHKAKSQTSIADDWARLGFVKVKTPAGMVWQGVALLP
jgi:putative DNA primase/helicase